jgi:glutathione S-transferase
MIKFFYSPRSSATRVQVALEELGVPYEKVRIHLDKGDQKKPEFLAVNPNGKVPALVDGDVKVFESVAILAYLGERYGVDKGMWPKAGTPEAGEALSWTVWSSTEFSVPLFEVVMHGTDFQWAHPKEHRSAHAAEQGRKRWNECIQILDKRLEGRDFLLGKSYTLADCAVGHVVTIGPMFAGLPVDSKNVAAWVARITARPAFAKVMSEQQ